MRFPLPFLLKSRSRYRSVGKIDKISNLSRVGPAIALLTTLLTTACQPTVQAPNPTLQSPATKAAIDSYLAAKIIQPEYGGNVFCSHNILGAELQKQPQKIYVGMLCQEYYYKDQEYRAEGHGALGAVALTVAQSGEQSGAETGNSLKVLSHQTTESKDGKPTLEDLFPAAILASAKEANSNASPTLRQANIAKADQYFIQVPVLKNLIGTWVGRSSLSPLASKQTRELLTFTPEGTTYSILQTDWDFLAVPVLQRYQITIPPAIEQPKPLGITLTDRQDRPAQRGIFAFTTNAKQLRLNLATPPDPLPTQFSGPNNLTFDRQNDDNIKIMANLEGIAAAGLARAIQQAMASYIQQGQFDPAAASDPLPFMNTLYRFQAQRLDDRRLQITAIAPSFANLPSFTAGVILANLSPGVPGGLKTPLLIGGICRSLQPNASPMPMPTLSENQEVVTCPPGSQRLAIQRS